MNISDEHFEDFKTTFKQLQDFCSEYHPEITIRPSDIYIAANGFKLGMEYAKSLIEKKLNEG